MPVNICPHCGTKLYGGLVSRCYKCKKSVSIAEETKKENIRRNNQKKEEVLKERDPKMRVRYSTLFDSFSKGTACIYDTESLFSGLLIHEGLKGWTFFVLNDGIKEISYTCLVCEKCQYKHLITIPWETTQVRSDPLFWVRLADSFDPADWYADFKCKKCKTAHKEVPAIVSGDCVRLDHYNNYGEFWVLRKKNPFSMKALAELKSFDREAKKARRMGRRWCPPPHMRCEYVKREV